SQELIRLQFEGDKVIHEERLLGELKARIRDVRQGPDGFLYVLTDEDDGVLYRVGLNQD
ncbi:PQQ-dependent sugar dehydrogenase, partial [Pseudomonas sp. SIMBA_064]